MSTVVVTPAFNAAMTLERTVADIVVMCHPDYPYDSRLGDVPAPARSFEAASSINFRRSLRIGALSLLVIAQCSLHALGVRRSPLFDPR